MKDDKIILEQILEFIERIEKYTSDIGFDEFSEDIQSLKSAILQIKSL